MEHTATVSIFAVFLPLYLAHTFVNELSKKAAKYRVWEVFETILVSEVSLEEIF